MNKLIMSSSYAVFLLAPLLAPLAAHSQSVGEKTGVDSALGISPTTPQWSTSASVTTDG